MSRVWWRRRGMSSISVQWNVKAVWIVLSLLRWQLAPVIYIYWLYDFLCLVIKYSWTKQVLLSIPVQFSSDVCEVYRGSVVAAATERRSVCVCVCGAAPVSNTAPIFNTTQPDKLRPVARYRRSCKLLSRKLVILRECVWVARRALIWSSWDTL